MSALETLVTKLAHPLAEVRQRAAHSIRSKVEAQLLSADELRMEPNLGSNLLQLASSADSSPTVKLDALSLIERIATAADTARRLVQLGAISELQRVQQQSTLSPQPTAEAEDASDNAGVDAVAAAAARAVDTILRHPANELPLVSSPDGQHTPNSASPAIASTARKETVDARNRPPLISAARVSAATAGTSASRSLDFASLVAAGGDQ